MRIDFVSSLIGALFAASVPAATAHAENHHRTTKLMIFVGGEDAAWKASVHAAVPGALSVEDIPADVGNGREIEPRFKSEQQPLGIARTLTWTGVGPAEYSFRGSARPPLNGAGWLSTRGLWDYQARGFLVFNLKVIENGGTDLRIGVGCDRGRSAVGHRHCRARYPLHSRALSDVGIWRTYRIPLSELLPAYSGSALLDDERVAFAIENEGSSRMTIALADVRWESFAHGHTYAESQTEDLLESLTLEEKIGQMAQVVHNEGSEAGPVFPADVAELKLGSLFGDSSTPPHDATGSVLSDEPATWVEFLNAYQRAALSTDKAIPMLFGMDAVHGLALVPGATIFPHNIGLAASGNPALLEAVAHATAIEAAALGFRLTFSPTLAVARDERWGRTYESLSELPEVVGRFGRALVHGYQGDTSWHDLGALGQPGSVLATAKHFGGDGAGEFSWPEPCTAFPCGSGFSVDRSNTNLDEYDLIALHLRAYWEAIGAGVGAIMISDSLWKSAPGTGNRHLITDILKQQFGFQGIVITDYHSWAGLYPDDANRSMLESVMAGNDLIMLPTKTDYAVLEQVVTEGVAAGTIPEERVNDAVRRILRKKFELGLFDIPFAQSAWMHRVGSIEHHALARRAVAESLVLLKNDQDTRSVGRVLPLKKELNVYVAGKAANDIGIQSGGWTNVWQGVLGNDLPGTTVLQGIKELARGSVVHSPDASQDMAGSDVGVVVVGEYPYAEFCGDVLGTTFFCEFSRPNPSGLVRLNPDLPYPLPIGLPQPQTLELKTSSFDYFSPYIENTPIPVVVDPISDLEVIARVCSAMPCVVVLLSGRPMFIEEALEQADAFVAGWLPGAEGAGIADVLYAEHGANFVGRLLHTWPATPRDPLYPSQVSSTPELDYVPQNVFVNGNGNLDHVLFPVGYGIRYGS